MEATHRYRLLLYFVALVLCLSACFAYAEEPAASGTSQPARLLFQTSGPRSAFMPNLTQTFIPTAPTKETAATVSTAKLDQVSAYVGKSHGIWHNITGNRHRSKLTVTSPQSNMHAATTESMKYPSANSVGAGQLQR
jgi:hypothetical protein